MYMFYTRILKLMASPERSTNNPAYFYKTEFGIFKTINNKNVYEPNRHVLNVYGICTASKNKQRIVYIFLFKFT